MLLLFPGMLPRVWGQDSLSFWEPTPSLHHARLAAVVGGEIALHTGSLIGLNEVWYKGHERTAFHFFDDSREWLQMDKVGHLMTSYYLGRVGKGMLTWSGVERKKAVWYGGSLGSVFLTSVELLDGYSERWGASWGDAVANLAGTGLFIGQELVWEEQRVVLKYSYHPTELAAYRPSVLGDHWSERMLKDYNGQSYWASFHVTDFLPGTDRLSWLCVSLGYGGTGMLGGHENPEVDEVGELYPVLERRRQYFLSFDIDLSRVETGSPFWDRFLDAFGFLKVPFPALEYNRVDGMRGHILYY